jgi:hypothetical protein
MSYHDEALGLLDFYVNVNGAVFVSLNDGESVVTPEGRNIATVAVLTPTDEARAVGELYAELTPEQRAHVDPWLEEQASRLEWQAAVDSL